MYGNIQNYLKRYIVSHSENFLHIPEDRKISTYVYIGIYRDMFYGKLTYAIEVMLSLFENKLYNNSNERTSGM